MSDQPGTLERVALVLSGALQSLGTLVPEDPNDLLEQLGIRLPPAVNGNASIASALRDVVAAAAQLPPATAALVSAITSGNAMQIASTAGVLVDRITSVLGGLGSVSSSVSGAAGGAGLPAAEVTAIQQAVANLPRRLLDMLVVEMLRTKGLNVLPTLTMLGIVDDAVEMGVSGNRVKPPFRRRQIHFDRFLDALSDPVAYLTSTFGFGTPGFDGMALFKPLEQFLDDIDFPVTMITVPGQRPVLEAYLFRLSTDTTGGTPKLTARLRMPANNDVQQLFPLRAPWSGFARAQARFGEGIEVSVAPPFQVEVRHPSTPITGELTAGVVGDAGADSIVLLGQTGKSRLEVKRLSASIGLRLAFDTATGRATTEPLAIVEVAGGHLLIDVGGSDGFISTIIGGAKLDANFGAKALWSASEGLRFQGSAALEIGIPTHISLGPIELETLYLMVGLAPAGVPIELSAAFKANLGPLKASVDRLGVKANLAFPPSGGNLGPVQLDFAFKPPTGVGLSLDLAVIRGGGFLSIDSARGQYAGALELALFDIVTISAIGIITTRMPDGSEGFSLLILMSVDFGTGIQLGFGFTLLAVGGLVGLNRRMNLDALANGIRSGAIESVMFPQDVIANAPRIITDLNAFFPPQQGTFLIGPMVKLGWGTPTLASVSLGIIVEIPGNIAIVGVLKVAIPADDLALIVLQVNFIGAIEFDKQRIWFFAALFESRVVFLTIEGEMGLLMAFGDDANFVLSVGGFHPRFSPPPLPFPSPRRISISLLSSPVSRVRIEGYFAVTSNTVQFGARVEVFFGLSAVNVQGHLAFDALFQFSPFYFVIEISASLSVKVFGAGLFSVRIRGSLEGPAPWHIEGTGSISLLFWDIDIDFETTWGESRNTEMPPIAVLPIIQAELEKAENWRSFLPPGTSLGVSLLPMEAVGADLVLHPIGTLRLSQRALPLDLKLDKVGNQKPSDVNRVSLAVTGGGLAKKADALERFAPAQFQNFTDAEKLSRPAFAPEHSGLDISAAGTDVRSSAMVRRIVRYEEIILDSNFKRFHRRFSAYLGSLFSFFLNGAAVTTCVQSKAAKSKLDPFDEKINVVADTYTVANQADNTPFSAESVSFHSEASAREFLAGQIAANPTLVDTIHVIPAFEAAA